MSEKKRYSDEELQEFKALILEKLTKAQKEYDSSALTSTTPTAMT